MKLGYIRVSRDKQTTALQEDAMRLFPILSVPACCLWMEISFANVLERKTLKKKEVNEDGRVAVSPPG